MTHQEQLRDPRGFFAIGVSHPKTRLNIGTLWRSANLFGAAFVFTVGRRYREQSSDTLKTPRHVPLLHFDNLDDLREHLPWSAPLVGVELTDDATPIQRFRHEQRAVYLLGAEDHGLTPNELAQCHRRIVLPGRFSLNVSVAGSLVLFHRWQQREATAISEAAE
jgi:tRNA G18 (ribose-2'-O)-methylase SpoU